MSVTLQKKLDELGCDLDAQNMEKTIADVFASMYPGWTDERLVCDEIEPAKFVHTIRRKLKRNEDKLPYSLVLSTLMNLRKRSCLK
jgi:hypothetical protein